MNGVIFRSEILFWSVVEEEEEEDMLRETKKGDKRPLLSLLSM